MTNELRHRHRLPPIERLIRRVKDRFKPCFVCRRLDILELVSCVVIALLVSGLLFFAIDALRRARP